MQTPGCEVELRLGAADERHIIEAVYPHRFPHVVRPREVPPTPGRRRVGSWVLASRAIALTSFERPDASSICDASFGCQRTTVEHGWRKLCGPLPRCRSISSKFASHTLGQYRAMQKVSKRVPHNVTSGVACGHPQSAIGRPQCRTKKHKESLASRKYARSRACE